MSRRTLFAGVATLLLLGANAGADGGIRDARRLGVIAGYSPQSQLVGPGIGANPVPWFRLEAGYLVSSSSDHKFNSTLQTTGKFMVSDWDTTPYAGFGSGPQGNQLAIVVGVDYTASNGINVGAGYSKVAAAGASSAVLYGGYYF